MFAWRQLITKPFNKENGLHTPAGHSLFILMLVLVTLVRLSMAYPIRVSHGSVSLFFQKFQHFLFTALVRQAQQIQACRHGRDIKL